MIFQPLEVEKMFQCIFDGCTSLFRTTSELIMNLKSSLIDEEEGIYFVRSTLKGQDFKVHVNLGLMWTKLLVWSV